MPDRIRVNPQVPQSFLTGVDKVRRPPGRSQKDANEANFRRKKFIHGSEKMCQWFRIHAGLKYLSAEKNAGRFEDL